jgi:hypothetical protein
LSWIDVLGLTGICDCLDISVNKETETLRWSWNPLNGFGVYETDEEVLQDGASVNLVPSGQQPYVVRLRVEWKKPLSEECCKERDSQSTGTRIYAEYWLDDQQLSPTLGQTHLPMAGVMPNGSMRGAPSLSTGSSVTAAPTSQNLPLHRAGELRVKVTASSEVCYDKTFKIK